MLSPFSAIIALFRHYFMLPPLFAFDYLLSHFAAAS